MIDHLFLIPRYLYELLYPWLINCLHRADSLLAEHIEIQEREKARSVEKVLKKDKKWESFKSQCFHHLFSRAGKSKKKTKASAKKPKLRPYLAEIASYQVLHCITMHYVALSVVFISFNRAGSCSHVCWILQDAGRPQIGGKDGCTKPSVWQRASALWAQVWNFTVWKYKLAIFCPRFGAFAALLTPPLMPYSQYKVSRHRHRHRQSKI